MLEFEKFDFDRRQEYRSCLADAPRGCEYSFANLVMWGRQRCTFLDGYLVLFSQFHRRSVYPFPAGRGDLKPVLDAIIQDAHDRGIVCCLTCLTDTDCMALEELYPGRFRFHPDRDSCDYVYRIEKLAALKGRKLQKKRNHLNRFNAAHPNCTLRAITPENAHIVAQFAEKWYENRIKLDPTNDFHLERKALCRGLRHLQDLQMEGLMLEEDGRLLAITLGSPLTEDTFDVHFEKALEDVDGAYTAINQAFAQYLMEKHPSLAYLNREDDLGLPGLRKAKLSYDPEPLKVKFWARLWEDDDED